MTSSTLPSKAANPAGLKAPRLALLILGCALIAWILTALYTWFLDPEMKFWTVAAEQKLNWVEQMREQHGYVVGVVGGSTTTFGIDAEYIEKEHNLPVANLGLHVGMGPEALIGFGFSALRRGDILLLCLEPAAFTAEYPKNSKLGLKLALLLGQLDIVAWDNGPQELEFLKGLFAMPPGGYHAATMIGKLALGMPLYRYSTYDLRPGGLQVTKERRDFAAELNFSSPSEVGPISARGVDLLRKTQSAASERGIKLFYVLPWSYWPAETAKERRSAKAALLAMIDQHIRVLVEPNLGVHSELSDFADSGQHLTAEAAAARSSVLAETLKADRGSSNHQQIPRE